MTQPAVARNLCLILCPLWCVLVFLTAWLTHDSSSSYVGSDIPQSNSQETKVGLKGKLFNVIAATLCWLQRISPDSMRRGTTQDMRIRRYGLLRLEKKDVCEGSTSLKLATLPHIMPPLFWLVGWMSVFFGVSCLTSFLFRNSTSNHLLPKVCFLAFCFFIKFHYLAGSLSVGMPVKRPIAILWGAQLTRGKLEHPFHTKSWSVSV